MPQTKKRPKEEIIQSAFAQIMNVPDRENQDELAMILYATGNGIRIGQKIGHRKAKKKAQTA